MLCPSRRVLGGFSNNPDPSWPDADRRAELDRGLEASHDRPRAREHREARLGQGQLRRRNFRAREGGIAPASRVCWAGPEHGARDDRGGPVFDGLSGAGAVWDDVGPQLVVSVGIVSARWQVVFGIPLSHLWYMRVRTHCAGRFTPNLPVPLCCTGSTTFTRSKKNASFSLTSSTERKIQNAGIQNAGSNPITSTVGVPQ